MTRNDDVRCHDCLIIFSRCSPRAAARLIHSARNYDNITPLLRDFHML